VLFCRLNKYQPVNPPLTQFNVTTDQDADSTALVNTPNTNDYMETIQLTVSTSKAANPNANKEGPPKSLFIPQVWEQTVRDDDNNAILARLHAENNRYEQEKPDPHQEQEQEPFDFLETPHEDALIKNIKGELILQNITKNESSEWYNFTTQTWLKWIKRYNASYVPWTLT
jgi:hypothetical protein